MSLSSWKRHWWREPLGARIRGRREPDNHWGPPVSQLTPYTVQSTPSTSFQRPQTSLNWSSLLPLSEVLLNTTVLRKSDSQMRSDISSSTTQIKRYLQYRFSLHSEPSSVDPSVGESLLRDESTLRPLPVYSEVRPLSQLLSSLGETNKGRR